MALRADALRVLLVLVLLAALPAAAAAQGNEPAAPLAPESLSLFEKVFGMVLKDYVDPKSPETVIRGALQGAASSVGPECVYVPPSDVAAYKAMRPDDPVLPLYVTKDQDFARVLAVFPGQDPSIRPLDALRFIGDRSTYDMNYAQIQHAMRGKAGDKVPCVFMKSDSWQSYSVTLVRQAPPQARWVALPGAGGALVLAALDGSPSDALVKSLKGSRGTVVVDLRGCAPADTQDALRWAGLLLGPGPGPTLKGPKGSHQERLKGPGYLAGRPLRVLVNGTTARAGEVLALSLVERGAVLAGEPTFGWAPLFEEFPLDNGGLLRLTTAYFLDPDGQPIKNRPLQPAIRLTPAAGQTDLQAYQEVLKAALPATQGKAHGAAAS